MTEKLHFVAGGRTADVAAYGEGKVVKLYKTGFPVSDADREYAISEKLFRDGLPVAQPFGRVELEGRHGIVYERVEGVTMLALIGRDPSILLTEAVRLADLHAEMHRHSGEGLPSLKDELRSKILAASPLTASEQQRIIEYLAQLPEGSKLCHGDYHPDNVLIGTDGRVFVLDWLTAASGHPAADAARTTVLSAFGSLPDGIPDHLLPLLEAGRAAHLAEYIRRYTSLTGITKDEMERWYLPVCAARLAEGIPAKEKEVLLRDVRERLERQGMSAG